MIDAEARRRALCARHHLDRSAVGVLAATHALLALHSSDPVTPHLALWARVPGYQVEDLDTHLPGDLWRLHAMRRTLWVAPRAQVGVLDGAVGRKVAAKERQRLLGWIDRPDAADWLAGLESQVLEAVAASPGIHTRALNKTLPVLTTKIEVGGGKWGAKVPVSSRLLFVMAMDLKLQRTASTGTWRASQYGWRVAPSVEPVEPNEATRQLVEHYIARFGPVTMTDLRWWTGLTATAVKRALKALDAVEVALEPEFGDPTGWLLPEQVLPSANAVTLLPGLDPTPMGYKQRDWFLGPHGPALFDRNGNIGPTIWVDGRIVGGWAANADGRVLTRLLEDIGERAAAVEREVAALEAWLGGVSVTPRFRTPLEKELTA